MSADALASIKEDCAAFQKENAANLLRVEMDNGATAHRNGVDFWLTRNGHGAGFWGRGYEPAIDVELTNAAHAYGGSDVYLGDDGKIYLS